MWHGVARRKEQKAACYRFNEARSYGPKPWMLMVHATDVVPFGKM